MEEKILNRSIPWRDCIGMTVIAQPPAVSAADIRIEENPDLPDQPYVDVFQNGEIIYMVGEEVEIYGFDPESGTVGMYNAAEDIPFHISYDQYLRDFGTEWNASHQMFPYRIGITETLFREVEIYAETEQAALDQARFLYSTGEIVLEADDFSDKNIESRGVARANDLALHQVFGHPRELNPERLSSIVFDLSATICNRLIPQVAEHLAKGTPFIDVCAEARFPVEYHPNHTLVVWGEENDADDRFYSVAVYKNGRNGKPEEQLMATMSDSTSAGDLNTSIRFVMKRFASSLVQDTLSRKHSNFSDILKDAKIRSFQQEQKVSEMEQKQPDR